MDAHSTASKDEASECSAGACAESTRGALNNLLANVNAVIEADGEDEG